VRRWALRVPAAQSDAALLRMLDLFPGGVEQEEDGDHVVFAGYADEPPAPDLTGTPVEEGWEDRWREYHRPVRSGRLWIGPPWCEPEPPAVVIDPGRAFGTGAHGSTRAALELLQRLEPAPALDLGSGSVSTSARCWRSTSIRWPSMPRAATPSATGSTWRSPGPTC